MTTGPFLDKWIHLQQEAERPFSRFGDAVPSPDCDLEAAWHEPVIAPDGPLETGPFDDFACKARNLARRFAGRPRALLINAKLVTLLRRRDPPPHIERLFQRLWTTYYGQLCDALDARWLISSAQSLSDHGATEPQRRAGAELTLLCGLIKLYETDRLHSGARDPKPFAPNQVNRSLVLDMEPFAIGRGDLDRVLVTRIWRAAQGDPVAESLVLALIPGVLADDRGIFRRLRILRDKRRERRGAGPNP